MRVAPMYFGGQHFPNIINFLYIQIWRRVHEVNYLQSKTYFVSICSLLRILRSDKISNEIIKAIIFIEIMIIMTVMILIMILMAVMMTMMSVLMVMIKTIIIQVIMIIMLIEIIVRIIMIMTVAMVF